MDNLKRVIVDFKKLTPEVLKLLVDRYPDGYDDRDIISFKNAHGDKIEAVEVLQDFIDFFLLFFPVFGSLGHGAAPAAVTHVAAFPVLHRFFEAALRGVFIHLGAADFGAAAHDEDRRFLAAH